MDTDTFRERDALWCVMQWCGMDLSAYDGPEHCFNMQGIDWMRRHAVYAARELRKDYREAQGLGPARGVEV